MSVTPHEKIKVFGNISEAEKFASALNVEARSISILGNRIFLGYTDKAKYGHDIRIVTSEIGDTSDTALEIEAAAQEEMGLYQSIICHCVYTESDKVLVAFLLLK